MISGEEAAQIERMKYVLSHGVKKDLVERAREWPGVHAVRALTEGTVLEGYWFDRTQEYAARRRGKDYSRLEFATREILALDPLPCWGTSSSHLFRLLPPLPRGRGGWDAPTNERDPGEAATTASCSRAAAAVGFWPR